MERKRFYNWPIKQNTTLYYIQDTLKMQWFKKAKNTGINKYLLTNTGNKKPGVAILILDKVHFKAKSIKWSRGHFIILIAMFHIKFWYLWIIIHWRGQPYIYF